MNYYQQIKEKLIAQLKMIYAPAEALQQKIENIDSYLLELMTPKNFDGNSPYNILIQQKTAFERVTIALMQNGIQSPDKLPVLRFYSALNFYETQNKKNGNLQN